MLDLGSKVDIDGSQIEVNLFDGCALTVPCHEPGTAPVGFTIAGTQNTDHTILAIGRAVEKVIRG